MPAYDLIHNLVKTALVKDGWTITHDPLKLVIDELKGYVDLGAEKAIAAIKGNRKIAVEIKSFQGPSKMQALEGAIGQYQLYAAMLEELEPDRIVYLAITEPTFINVFDTKASRKLLQRLGIRLIVVSVQKEEVLAWID